MNPEQATLLTGILTVILGGGGISALVLWRKQRAQEPIDAETAAVANARSSAELALAIARQQTESVNALRGDLSLLRDEVNRLRALIDGTTIWIRDLHARWHEVRHHDQPPGGLPPGVL